MGRNVINPIIMLKYYLCFSSDKYTPSKIQKQTMTMIWGDGRSGGCLESRYNVPKCIPEVSSILNVWFLTGKLTFFPLPFSLSLSLDRPFPFPLHRSMINGGPSLCLILKANIPLLSWLFSSEILYKLIYHRCAIRTYMESLIVYMHVYINCKEHTYS